MGRYIGPACRMCRREGMQLFLKGDRCFMAKCPVQTGRPPPGMHGARRRKLSDYGMQLREKQRMRWYYGMQEQQFAIFFSKALRQRGITGERLLQMLEMRLDTIVWRMGFAPSRRAARQFIRHGHIRLNGHRADIPSIVAKAGDVVEVRKKQNSRDAASLYMETAETRGLVPWISVSREEFRGEVLHVPTRDEIAPIFNEQRVVELYSK
jgi:small subunit ribosomal protein S4